MPVILAFLLALTLTPIVRYLKWHGVPEPVSATLLVIFSVIALGTVGLRSQACLADGVNC